MAKLNFALVAMLVFASYASEVIAKKAVEGNVSVKKGQMGMPPD